MIGRDGLKRICMLGVLLAALLFQSLLIQSHRHFDEGAIGFHNTTGTENSPRKSGDNAPLKTCLLCEQLAFDGHGLLPDPVYLREEVSGDALLPFAVLLPLDLASASHRWQSRAPPR